MKWKNNFAKDSAVSPVIGTILMVAVTVVLGATVYAVMSGFGDDSIKERTNAAFKAQTVDTDGDGKTDHIKITYISGPTNVPIGDVALKVVNSTTGVAVVESVAKVGAWNPGDFLVYNPPGAGAYFVTVSILGDTVVDKSSIVDQ